MILFAYALSPIDFWFGWTPLSKVLEAPADESDDSEDFYFGCPERREVLERFLKAQELARRVGWEGDIRKGAGPFFAPIPWETGMYEYLLAWKQDNNGTTFVVSPVRLGWLDRIADEVVSSALTAA